MYRSKNDVAFAKSVNLHPNVGAYACPRALAISLGLRATGVPGARLGVAHVAVSMITPAKRRLGFEELISGLRLSCFG